MQEFWGVGLVILNAPARRTYAAQTRRIRDNPPYQEKAEQVLLCELWVQSLLGSVI